MQYSNSKDGDILEYRKQQLIVIPALLQVNIPMVKYWYTEFVEVRKTNKSF